MAAAGILRGTCSLSEALADESIDREWAGTADNEGCETGDIEQDDLITPPVRTGRAPLDSLANPCGINPYPMICRSGMGTMEALETKATRSVS
jgi:hypothetical protein